MKVLLGLLAFFSLTACDSTADHTPVAAVSSDASGDALALSKERVPRGFHLEGLAEDARFIKDTTTGGFEVRPRVNVDPGGRLHLTGQGCADATSVYVVLLRVEPLRAGQHDRDQTWIDTRTFPTTKRGWSSELQVPRRPAVAEYAVWAVCELGGHA